MFNPLDVGTAYFLANCRMHEIQEDVERERLAHDVSALAAPASAPRKPSKLAAVRNLLVATLMLRPGR